MKKWLSGVMMLMLCLAVSVNEVHADVIVGPTLSRGPEGLARGLAILAVIIVIVIITWKIIQNMKKK